MSEGVSTELDPHEANHVTVVGRKGSGKSVLARRLFDSYDGDRMVIDPTGDIHLEPEPGLTQLTDPLPIRWPMPPDERRSTLRYAPDMKSPTYVDEMDRAAGLAFGKGDALLWLDEVAVLTRANATPPHMRAVLHQSRHRNLSLLFCGPRPVDIDPLVLSQADYVAVFQTPNPRDRQRLADAMGLELPTMEAAHRELGEHDYLWYDARAPRDECLLVMPALNLTARPAGPDRFDRARARG